jgi:shikimate kinase/3-dehydroquinate synthase
MADRERTPRHIVLVGSMGAGKTTVGRLVAERLGWPFQDSDAALAGTAGATAAELARDEGTAALHAREAAILRHQLAGAGPSVIAAAWSVAEDDPAVEALGDPAVLVAWLRGAPELLIERARAGGHRPWHEREPLAYLRERAVVRDPIYARLAAVVVDVGATGPDDAATVIATAALTAAAPPSVPAPPPETAT